MAERETVLRLKIDNSQIKPALQEVEVLEKKVGDAAIRATAESKKSDEARLASARRTDAEIVQSAANSLKEIEHLTAGAKKFLGVKAETLGSHEELVKMARAGIERQYDLYKSAPATAIQGKSPEEHVAAVEKAQQRSLGAISKIQTGMSSLGFGAEQVEQISTIHAKAIESVEKLGSASIVSYERITQAAQKSGKAAAQAAEESDARRVASAEKANKIIADGRAALNRPASTSSSVDPNAARREQNRRDNEHSANMIRDLHARHRDQAKAAAETSGDVWNGSYSLPSRGASSEYSAATTYTSLSHHVDEVYKIGLPETEVAAAKAGLSENLKSLRAKIESLQQLGSDLSEFQDEAIRLQINIEKKLKTIGQKTKSPARAVSSAIPKAIDPFPSIQNELLRAAKGFLEAKDVYDSYQFEAPHNLKEQTEMVSAQNAMRLAEQDLAIRSVNASEEHKQAVADYVMAHGSQGSRRVMSAGAAYEGIESKDYQRELNDEAPAKVVEIKSNASRQSSKHDDGSGGYDSVKEDHETMISGSGVHIIDTEQLGTQERDPAAALAWKKIAEQHKKIAKMTRAEARAALKEAKSAYEKHSDRVHDSENADEHAALDEVTRQISEMERYVKVGSRPEITEDLPKTPRNNDISSVLINREAPQGWEAATEWIRTGQVNPDSDRIIRAPAADVASNLSLEKAFKQIDAERHQTWNDIIKRRSVPGRNIGMSNYDVRRRDRADEEEATHVETRFQKALKEFAHILNRIEPSQLSELQGNYKSDRELTEAMGADMSGREINLNVKRRPVFLNDEQWKLFSELGEAFDGFKEREGQGNAGPAQGPEHENFIESRLGESKGDVQALRDKGMAERDVAQRVLGAVNHVNEGASFLMSKINRSEQQRAINRENADIFAETSQDLPSKITLSGLVSDVNLGKLHDEALSNLGATPKRAKNNDERLARKEAQRQFDVVAEERVHRLIEATSGSSAMLSRMLDSALHTVKIDEDSVTGERDPKVLAQRQAHVAQITKAMERAISAEKATEQLEEVMAATRTEQERSKVAGDQAPYVFNYTDRFTGESHSVIHPENHQINTTRVGIESQVEDQAARQGVAGARTKQIGSKTKAAKITEDIHGISGLIASEQKTYDDWLNNPEKEEIERSHSFLQAAISKRQAEYNNWADKRKSYVKKQLEDPLNRATQSELRDSYDSYRHKGTSASALNANADSEEFSLHQQKLDAWEAEKVIYGPNREKPKFDTQSTLDRAAAEYTPYAPPEWIVGEGEAPSAQKVLNPGQKHGGKITKIEPQMPEIKTAPAAKSIVAARRRKTFVPSDNVPTIDQKFIEVSAAESEEDKPVAIRPVAAKKKRSLEEVEAIIAKLNERAEKEAASRVTPAAPTATPWLHLDALGNEIRSATAAPAAAAEDSRQSKIEDLVATITAEHQKTIDESGHDLFHYLPDAGKAISIEQLAVSGGADTAAKTHLALEQGRAYIKSLKAQREIDRNKTLLAGGGLPNLEHLSGYDLAIKGGDKYGAAINHLEDLLSGVETAFRESIPDGSNDPLAPTTRNKGIDSLIVRKEEPGVNAAPIKKTIQEIDAEFREIEGALRRAVERKGNRDPSRNVGKSKEEIQSRLKSEEEQINTALAAYKKALPHFAAFLNRLSESQRAELETYRSPGTNQVRGGYEYQANLREAQIKDAETKPKQIRDTGSVILSPEDYARAAEELGSREDHHGLGDGRGSINYTLQRHGEDDIAVQRENLIKSTIIAALQAKAYKENPELTGSQMERGAHEKIARGANVEAAGRSQKKLDTWNANMRELTNEAAQQLTLAERASITERVDRELSRTMMSRVSADRGIARQLGNEIRWADAEKATHQAEAANVFDLSTSRRDRARVAPLLDTPRLSQLFSESAQELGGLSPAPQLETARVNRAQATAALESAMKEQVSSAAYLEQAKEAIKSATNKLSGVKGKGAKKEAARSDAADALRTAEDVLKGAEQEHEFAQLLLKEAEESVKALPSREETVDLKAKARYKAASKYQAHIGSVLASRLSEELDVPSLERMLASNVAQSINPVNPETDRDSESFRRASAARVAVTEEALAVKKATDEQARQKEIQATKDRDAASLRNEAYERGVTVNPQEVHEHLTADDVAHEYVGSKQSNVVTASLIGSQSQARSQAERQAVSAEDQQRMQDTLAGLPDAQTTQQKTASQRQEDILAEAREKAIASLQRYRKDPAAYNAATKRRAYRLELVKAGRARQKYSLEALEVLSNPNNNAASRGIYTTEDYDAWYQKQTKENAFKVEVPRRIPEQDIHRLAQEAADSTPLFDEEQAEREASSTRARVTGRANQGGIPGRAIPAGVSPSKLKANKKEEPIKVKTTWGQVSGPYIPAFEEEVRQTAAPIKDIKPKPIPSVAEVHKPKSYKAVDDEYLPTFHLSELAKYANNSSMLDFVYENTMANSEGMSESHKSFLTEAYKGHKAALGTPVAEAEAHRPSVPVSAESAAVEANLTKYDLDKMTEHASNKNAAMLNSSYNNAIADTDMSESHRAIITQAYEQHMAALGTPVAEAATAETEADRTRREMEAQAASNISSAHETLAPEIEAGEPASVAVKKKRSPEEVEAILAKLNKRAERKAASITAEIEETTPPFTPSHEWQPTTVSATSPSAPPPPPPPPPKGPPIGPSGSDEEDASRPRSRQEIEAALLKRNVAAAREIDARLTQNIYDLKLQQKEADKEYAIEALKRRRQKTEALREANGDPSATLDTPRARITGEDTNYAKAKLLNTIDPTESNFASMIDLRKGQLQNRVDNPRQYNGGPTRQAALEELKSIAEQENRYREKLNQDKERSYKQEAQYDQGNIQSLREHYEERAATARTGSAEYSKARASLYNLEKEEYGQDKALAIDKQRSALLPAQTALRRGAVWRSAGTAMSSTGQALTYGLTAPLIGGIGYSIKAATDEEAQFARVKETFSSQWSPGAAGKVEQTDVESQLLKMSATNPTKFEELAKIAAIGGQLGVAKKDVVDFTHTIMQMGVAILGIDPTHAATEMAKLKNTLEMPDGAKSIREIANVVSELHSNKDVAASAQDILAFGQRIAGVGNVIGMHMPQILALGAGFVSTGTKTEQGGTALQRTIIMMAASIANSKDQLDKLKLSGKELNLDPVKIGGATKYEAQFATVAGMTPDAFRTSFKDDPYKAITAFITGLHTATEEQKNVFRILDSIGGKGIKQQRTVATLLQGSNYNSFDEIGRQSGAAAGKTGQADDSLSEKFRIQMDTTKAQMDTLKNFASVTATLFGKSFLPIITGTIIPEVEHILTDVAKLTDGFNKLSQTDKNMLFWSAMVLGAIGPVTSAFGHSATIIGEWLRAYGSIKALKTGEVSMQDLMMQNFEFSPVGQIAKRRQEVISQERGGAASADLIASMKRDQREAEDAFKADRNKVGGAAKFVRGVAEAKNGSSIVGDTEMVASIGGDIGIMAAGRVGKIAKIGEEAEKTTGILGKMGTKFADSFKNISGLETSISRFGALKGIITSLPESIALLGPAIADMATAGAVGFAGFAAAALPVLAAMAGAAYAGITFYNTFKVNQEANSTWKHQKDTEANSQRMDPTNFARMAAEDTFNRRGAQILALDKQYKPGGTIDIQNIDKGADFYSATRARLVNEENAAAAEIAHLKAQAKAEGQVRTKTGQNRRSNQKETLDFQQVAALAKEAGDPHPNVTAAQWALESGFGHHLAGKNNYFGIKGPGTSNLSGEFENGHSVMRRSSFRDFASPEEGVAYHTNLLTHGRYAKAGYNTAQDDFAAIDSIAKAGYATDPNYASQLKKMILLHGGGNSKISSAAVAKNEIDMNLFDQAAKAKKDDAKNAAVINAEGEISGAQGVYDDDVHAYERSGNLKYLIDAKNRIDDKKGAAINAARLKAASSVSNPISTAAELNKAIGDANDTSKTELRDLREKIEKIEQDREYVKAKAKLVDVSSDINARTQRLSNLFETSSSFAAKQQILNKQFDNSDEVTANAKSLAQLEMKHAIYDDPTKKTDAVATRRSAYKEADNAAAQRGVELAARQYALTQSVQQNVVARLEIQKQINSAEDSQARTTADRSLALDREQATQKKILNDKLIIEKISQDPNVSSLAEKNYELGNAELTASRATFDFDARVKHAQALANLYREQASLTDNLTKRVQLLTQAREQDTLAAKGVLDPEEESLRLLQQTKQAVQDKRDADKQQNDRTFATGALSHDSNQVMKAIGAQLGQATSGDVIQRSQGINDWAQMVRDAVKNKDLTGRQALSQAVQMQDLTKNWIDESGKPLATKNNYDIIQETGRTALAKMMHDEELRLNATPTFRKNQTYERDLKSLQSDPQVKALGLTEEAVEEFKQRFKKDQHSIVNGFFDEIKSGAAQAGTTLIEDLLNPKTKKGAVKKFWDDIVKEGEHAFSSFVEKNIESGISSLGGAIFGGGKSKGTPAASASGIASTGVGLISDGSALFGTGASTTTVAATGAGTAAASGATGTAAASASGGAAASLAAAAPWIAGALILSNPAAVHAITSGISNIISAAGKAEAEVLKGIGSAAESVLKGIGEEWAGIGKGIGAAAQGIGGGVGSAAKGIGQGVGSAASGVGSGLGSIIGAFTGGNAMRVATMNVASMNNVHIQQGGGLFGGGKSGGGGGGGILGGIVGAIGGVVGAIGSIFGFAEGGKPPIGSAFLTGEHGPEIGMTAHSMQIFSNSDSIALAPFLASSGMLSSKALNALGIKSPQLKSPGAPSPFLGPTAHGIGDGGGLGASIRDLANSINSIPGGDTVHAQATFTGPIHSDVDITQAGTVFAKTISRGSRVRSSIT